ncbi:50S ribosomal protein L11 [Cardinium endosymbiont cEper1 of Encarsia pergandiella]|uniref:50S ribosomal protein L11 n=1 Tax=Cardinium endosymbiont of Encarsia pergandiella TaxID=249402 RepID=UPI00027E9F3E|nr:50S ribosomal protein L11 [Cardinium endosymbiont of Encarsia pergandiella]CCM10111.1 50S ribosomal protein L11 [Cardinium endosymbiont cEper1 of Encarsia pergandiella]
MSKPVLGYVKLRVKGGSANPSPPVGPALGSKGINIMEFCKQFNARTKDQQGEIVPVIITVYQDKSFDFIIKTSPTVVAIMKLAEIAKGSPESNRRKVASISWEQIQQIAEEKLRDLNTLDIHAAMRMVAGTARSMGVTVQGIAPWVK